MFPPQRYPILMYFGSRFENGRLCAKANGPNLNGFYLINTKGGGSRRGGYSPALKRSLAQLAVEAFRWRETVQGKRRQSADIKGNVCSSTLNRFPDTSHSDRAHSKIYRRGGLAPRRTSPSLTFTRYCHHQYCMVHGIKGGEVDGGAYIAHWSCNSIAIG